jgi:aspartyl-tRNA(Asn)/glutamyl-tRNA(Gln) amidotransferase subunit B
VPLVEIVTEPDFHDALEVKEYLQKLQQIVRYLDVSNADMEKGEMRLEPNISLATDPKKLPNYKVEVKNINSFSFVEKAIRYETKRQEEILEEGNRPAQETRGWDENRQKTFSQRSKEEAHDYRYFPEPDIPPILTSVEEISRLKSSVPELPDKKLKRFMADFSLTEYDSEILTREIYLANFFEEAVKAGKDKNLKPKDIANFIINKKVEITSVTPLLLVQQIASSKQVATIDTDELKTLIESVINENSKAVEEYKSGKEAVIMFLVGQTMKKIGKKVDVTTVKDSLVKALK